MASEVGPGVGPSPEVVLAVTKVVSDYALSYDAGDFDRFSRLWAENATFTTIPDLGVLPIPMVGRDSIVAALESLWHRNRGIAVRHYTTNISVEIGADERVVAASAILAVSDAAGAGTPIVHRSGRYDDVFVKEGGVWRFAERVITFDFADAAPGPDAVA